MPSYIARDTILTATLPGFITVMTVFGAAVSDALPVILDPRIRLVLPGMSIVTVPGFNDLGDALRDAADPCRP